VRIQAGDLDVEASRQFRERQRAEADLIGQRGCRVDQQVGR